MGKGPVSECGCVFYFQGDPGIFESNYQMPDHNSTFYKHPFYAEHDK